MKFERCNSLFKWWYCYFDLNKLLQRGNTRLVYFYIDKINSTLIEYLSVIDLILEEYKLWQKISIKEQIFFRG